MTEHDAKEPRMEDFEKEIALAEERMKKLKEDLEHVDPQVVEKAKKILQANAEASAKSTEDLGLDLEFDFSEEERENPKQSGEQSS